MIADLSAGGRFPLMTSMLNIFAMCSRVFLLMIFFNSVQGMWSFPGADLDFVVVRTALISVVVISCHVLVGMGMISISMLRGSHAVLVGVCTKCLCRSENISHGLGVSPWLFLRGI